MLAEKRQYAYDYNMESTAKKIKYDDYINKQRKNRVKPKQNTESKGQISLKTKASTVLMIVALFSALLLIVHRYNIISERNYTVQNLKKQVDSSKASETEAQIEVEQGTDLNSIEAYAKQQLGMQKPTKNQMIYIDNSQNTSVKNTQNTTVIDKVVNKVKDLIKQVF